MQFCDTEITQALNVRIGSCANESGVIERCRTIFRFSTSDRRKPYDIALSLSRHGVIRQIESNAAEPTKNRGDRRDELSFIVLIILRVVYINT